MTDTNIIVLQKETYLKMIENSPDTRLFNSIMVRYKDTNTIDDICHDGEFSCAFFVSSVLCLANYIEKPMATVTSVCEHLKKNGWRIISGNPIKGDVVVWDYATLSNNTKDINMHIGFALSATEAVSTSSISRRVTVHNITYGLDAHGTPKRRIKMLLRV